jgi:hypothetical protein
MKESLEKWKKLEISEKTHDILHADSYIIFRHMSVVFRLDVNLKVMIELRANIFWGVKQSKSYGFQGFEWYYGTKKLRYSSLLTEML